MINLFGITGPARHGKDTVGQMLMKHLPSLNRFAFADKLKEFLEEAFEYGEHWTANKEGDVLFFTTRESIETAILNVLHEGVMMFDVDVQKATDDFIEVLREHHGNFYWLADGRILFTSSWRKMLQLTGTEWGRQRIDELFWITPWLPDGDAVVTDVRAHGDSAQYHDIEAQSIKAKGGIMIKVYDPRKGSVVRNHSSEAGIGLDHIDYTIVNQGDLAELEHTVCRLLERIYDDKASN